MANVDSSKKETTTHRDSANSKNRLIIDSINKKVFPDEPSSEEETTKEKPKETFEKLKSAESPSPPAQNLADRPTTRGAFGMTIATTIIWYIGIGILFIIAFLSLILSILYYVTDTSTDSILKLYGIAGSGALAVITFVIVFLDCCNDAGKKDLEQEALYRVLQAKEAREKAFALRRKRRIAEGAEPKPKPLNIPHQPVKVVEKPPPDPHPHPYHHMHPHPHATHVHSHHAHFPHPINPLSQSSYHHPFVCPICHDLHASGNARHNLLDVGVDTNDKFAPVVKSKRLVHKSTRDAQTEPELWDTERGTQTDRTEGTQTSNLELQGMPSNVTQIIHETTILKAPRNLIGTLKASMVKQDRDLAFKGAVTDSNRKPSPIV